MTVKARDAARRSSAARTSGGDSARAGTGEQLSRAERVARQMRTGQVDINGGQFNPSAPFGGYKQSGIGRERGRYGLEEFIETKAMQR